jgi:hypothetical protein
LIATSTSAPGLRRHALGELENLNHGAGREYCITAPVIVSTSAVASRTSTPVIRLISCRATHKKTDVVEHRKVFNHVGLLVNGPPGTAGAALHLVIRRRQLPFCLPEPIKLLWLHS